MTKTVQLVTSAVSFISGKTTHDLGVCSASQAVEHSSGGILAKTGVTEH